MTFVGFQSRLSGSGFGNRPLRGMHQASCGQRSWRHSVHGSLILHSKDLHQAWIPRTIQVVDNFFYSPFFLASIFFFANS
jgi:hypothetical protein